MHVHIPKSLFHTMVLIKVICSYDIRKWHLQCFRGTVGERDHHKTPKVGDHYW